MFYLFFFNKIFKKPSRKNVLLQFSNVHVELFINLLLCLFLLLSQSTEAKKYPCAYEKTVNITDGLRLKDGSYSFDSYVIPAHLVAEYNIKVIDGIEYGAERHMRGCICLITPCISFCCPLGMIYNADQRNCTQRVGTNALLAATNTNNINSNQHVETLKPGHIDITQSNGIDTKVINIEDIFIVRYEFGCRQKFINFDNENFLKWDLFANGTLGRDGKLWSTDEYCFSPMERKNVWSLTPLTCVRHESGSRVWIYVICFSLAIILNTFMVLFLISINRFRNNEFGESLIFYFISVTIAYVALVYLALKNPMKLSEAGCRSLGFTAYYFVMLSFLLLNFISWEFWCKFTLRSCTECTRKIVYVLVVLLAFLMKFMVKYAQDSNLPRYLKPGIGDATCWFDVRLLGILFYYYIPLLVSLCFSGFCAAKAYIAIWQLHVTHDNSNAASNITAELQLAKSQFYAFATYLIGVISISVREFIVWTAARLREHYFFFDYWIGVFVLGLAITGCVCFLCENRLVNSWWRTNVANKPDDFLGVRLPKNRIESNETVRSNEIVGIDDAEQITLNKT